MSFIVTIETEIVVVRIIRIVIPDDASTVIAANVVAVEAVFAKLRILIANGVVSVNHVAAMVAPDTAFVCTILAQNVIIHAVIVVVLDLTSAPVADTDFLIFAHRFSSFRHENNPCQTAGASLVYGFLSLILLGEKHGAVVDAVNDIQLGGDGIF